MIITLFVVVLLCLSKVKGSDFNLGRVKSWNVKADAKEYPETDLLTGTNSALALSGGGTRAYLNSIGSLKALLDLGLMDNLSYLSSVSGGSWANSAYTFFQESRTGISIEEFLGDIIEPHELNWATLKSLDTRSARASPVNRDMVTVLLGNMAKGIPLGDIWAASVAQVFLEPAGIYLNDRVAWNQDLLAEQINRNPWLENYTFVLPCEGATICRNKPFSILNAAILGPSGAVPFRGDYYLPIEMNPIYVGSPQRHKFTFQNTRKTNVDFSVGGFVETAGFGGIVRGIVEVAEGDFPPPFFGLGPDAAEGVIDNVPVPSVPFSLANSTAISSFAPGSLLSSSGFLKPLDQLMGTLVDYWSPVIERTSDPVFSTPVYVADGASVENNGLLALIRRGVEEIIVFVNSPLPLKSRSHFDPFKRSPKPSDVDLAFSCYFGYDEEPRNPVEDLKHNAVFPRYQFANVIDSMQKAQSEGNGIVVRQELNTVENSYWGIPAGRRVNVTWVYLSRCIEWEKQLPTSVRLFVTPELHPDDHSSLRLTGPFSSFPHYATSKLHYSAVQANMMTNMAGWVVKKNRHIFEMALGQKPTSPVQTFM